MSDTLDLLEAIGGNAALRHASAEELAKTLAEAGASDALLAAVTAGDNAKLAEELGLRPMQVNHDSHTGGHEDDDETPDHGDGGDEPSQPSQPAQGGTSHS